MCLVGHLRHAVERDLETALHLEHGRTGHKEEESGKVASDDVGAGTLGSIGTASAWDVGPEPSQDSLLGTMRSTSSTSKPGWVENVLVSAPHVSRHTRDSLCLVFVGAVLWFWVVGVGAVIAGQDP